MANSANLRQNAASQEQRLPLSLSEFFGRDQEIATLQSWIVGNHSRLISILGPGGIGKSRLSLELARLVESEFDDGAAIIELGALRHSDLVPHTLAHALVPSSNRLDLTIESLSTAIGARNQLVVLDCFEPVIDAAPMIPQILERCPALTILVTSRERLQVTGEQEFHLGALAVPPVASESDPMAALASPSVQLFINRARSVDSALTFTAESAGVLAAICQRLEGLPLAIELAASRCAHVTPNALLPLLAQRLPMLTGGSRHAPDRHRTMRDAIRWSVDLLSDQEVETFRRLAIFPGRFSLAAAQRVIEMGSPNSEPPLDILSRLVDKNLVKREADLAGSPRFTMLDTIHEFAGELLQEAGEESLAAEAHDGYFHDLGANLAATRSGSQEESIAVQQLDACIDSVRGWLDRTERSSTTEALLNSLVALNRFWRVASRQSEGIECYDRVLATASGNSSLPVAQAFESRGYLLRDSGNYARAAESFHAALAGYRVAGDPVGASRAHNSLGALAGDLGNASEARFHAEEALALQQAADDRWGIARSLHNLGWIAIEEGNTEEAGSLFHQSADLWSETGDIDSHGRALNSLGALTSMLGHYDAAMAHYLQSIALYRRIGAGYLLAESLSDLAAVEIALRRYNEAAAALFECLSIYQEIGIRFRFTEAIETVAALALGFNRFTLAHRFLEASSIMREESGLPPLVTWSGRLAEWQQTVANALGNNSGQNERQPTNPAQALQESLEFVRGIVDKETVRGSNLAGLSRRELEILQLICQGLSDQEIAARLFISKRTASNHVASILQKLDVPSRAAAAVTATKAGII